VHTNTFSRKQNRQVLEVTEEYSKNGKKLSVFYCAPSKKDRNIFGGLVPYGEVWRTGANEATTFTSNTDLEIGGEMLSAGKYTLWTIPGEKVWTVIWNSKQYGWGVDFKSQALRDPEADALQVKVPVQNLDTPVELFTITFEENNDLALVFAWDRTKVSVPIK
jgi:hypothetical protein